MPRWIWGVALLMLVAGAGLGLHWRSNLLAEERRAAQEGAQRATAAAAAQRLATELDREWDRLRAVANAIHARGALPQTELRALMDSTRSGASQIVWMGTADAANGRVLAATGGVIEGADVSERPWFREGRQGEFAGNVHDAVLLQRALNRDPRDEPMRLIDFVTPLRDPAGRIVAVVGAHVDWNWIAALVREAAEHGRTPVALVSSAGVVLFGPDAAWQGSLPRHLAVPVPQRADTPSLGWRMVAVP